jgi:hypothetical protein
MANVAKGDGTVPTINAVDGDGFRLRVWHWFRFWKDEVSIALVISSQCLFDMSVALDREPSAARATDEAGVIAF